MKPETKGKIKCSAWGLFLGAIIAMIFGFGWGGLKTTGMSKTIAREAVQASQAKICVAQFMRDSNREENFKEFGKLKSWSNAEFIEKGGWDKMPGQEKADPAVTRACADRLELLIKK